MRLLYLILFIFISSSVFAQIGTLTISPKVEERIILPYDSLKNITRSNLPSLVGQQVQILPKQRIGSLGLDSSPILYKSKPTYRSKNNIVVNPDTRLCSFDNEVFDIVGVDSIFDADISNYRRGKFYLIVTNEKYPNHNYLEIASVSDDYDIFSKRLKRREEFDDSYKFVILGYYEKSRERLIGTKLVNKYVINYHGGDYIVYEVISGKPLTLIPENLIWTIKDIINIESQEQKGLGYVLTSDSTPECFVLLSKTGSNYFDNYDKFIEEQQLKQKWEQRMIKTYGETNGQLIIQGEVKIGFTRIMCIESWGSPRDINTSSGSWGDYEQWVYGNGSYLYFENGKLTSIDN